MELFKLTCSEIDEMYHSTRKNMREINAEMIRKYQTIFRDEDFYSFDNHLAPAYVQNSLRVKQALKELLDADPAEKYFNQFKEEVQKINATIEKLKLFSKQQSTMTQESDTPRTVLSDISNKGAILRIPAAKLTKVENIELQKKLKTKVDAELKSIFAKKIQRRFRKYMIKRRKLYTVSVQKISKALAVWLIRRRFSHFIRKAKSAIVFIQYQWRRVLRKRKLHKKRAILNRFTNRLSKSKGLKVKGAFEKLESYSFLRKKLMSKAFSLLKESPVEKIHINKLRRIRFGDIIPEEGKYKMAEVFYNKFLIHAVFYRWLIDSSKIISK